MNQAPDFRGFFFFGLVEAGTAGQPKARSFDGINNGVVLDMYHPRLSVPFFPLARNRGTDFA